MDSNFKPRLRHCTIVDDVESEITKFVVGREYFDVRLTGNRDQFLKMKSFFDGRHTISKIADLSGINEASVAEIVGQFAELGLFQNRREIDAVDKEDFLSRINDTSLMWRRQIGLHPMFGQLISKTCRKEVFIGYLIESYHYVRMLPARLYSILGEIRDKQIRIVISDYAQEELEHYKQFETTLRNIPLYGENISESHPAPGTISLINSFESVGCRNDLSLACCVQMIEAHVSEVDQAESHLRKMAQNFDMEEFVEPYIHHMKVDVAMEHSNLLEEALKNKRSISANACHDAVNDMHDIKHHFDIFHQSILDYYGDISNYIPRLKVDYFAL